MEVPVANPVHNNNNFGTDEREIYLSRIQKVSTCEMVQRSGKILTVPQAVSSLLVHFYLLPNQLGQNNIPAGSAGLCRHGPIAIILSATVIDIGASEVREVAEPSRGGGGGRRRRARGKGGRKLRSFVSCKCRGNLRQPMGDPHLNQAPFGKPRDSRRIYLRGVRPFDCHFSGRHQRKILQLAHLNSDGYCLLFWSWNTLSQD